MTKEQEDKILREAIRQYGVACQYDVLIEEMSELTKAIIKQRRASRAHQHLEAAKLIDNIIEEIADVRIMLDQAELMTIPSECLKVREEKLRRLAIRLGVRYDTEGDENV